MTDHKLLEWALSLVRAAQENKIYGTVTVCFEGGVITKTKTEKYDKPPRA